MADVLVLLAHPHLETSRVNRAMARAATRDGGDHVEVVDLYAHYPDYLIDVAAEQQRLSRARLIVWQFPLQWYTVPSLLKLWLDEVLSYGWAYGPGGQALAGKDLWLAATTGGREDAYRPDGRNRYFFDAFLPPFEQTAALCGLRFVPPLVLHGAHQVDEETLQRHADTYAQRLRDYPAWPELESLEMPEPCLVVPGERPVDGLEHAA